MPKLSAIKLTKEAVENALPGQCLSDKDVRGFRLKVTPKGTKRFVAQYRVKGGGGRESSIALGTYPQVTVQEARNAALKVLARVREGGDPQDDARALRDAGRAARSAPTVADLVKLYVEDYGQSRPLSPATIRQARYLLGKATAKLGKMKVADVGIADMRRLHGAVRCEGIAAGTKGVYQANRLLATLSKAFSLAIEEGWRTGNPCKGVKRSPEDSRSDNLSPEAVGALQRACALYATGVRPVRDTDTEEEAEAKRTPLPEAERSATDLAASNAILLLLFTGARLQEVLRAEWSQFDLAQGLWVKPSAHTKTKREHRLELEGPALDVLRDMAASKLHARFLFPGRPELRRKGSVEDGRGITPRADLRYPWRVILELAGLSGVKLHDLRRTTASFMLSDGATLATVGKALGHTQVSTTAAYAHLGRSIQGRALGQAGERMKAAAMLPPQAPKVVPIWSAAR